MLCEAIRGTQNIAADVLDYFAKSMMTHIKDARIKLKDIELEVVP